MPSGGRFRRGLRLVRQSFQILRSEPGLLLVAVVAAVINVAIIGAGILAEVSLHHADALSGPAPASAVGHFSAAQYAVLAAMGVATTVVSIMARATIVIRVVALLRGQPISNGRALSMALAKSPHLIGYAIVSYVVRLVIQQVSNRGILGRIAGTGMWIAWQIGAFFAVPVIVFEDLGPFAAVKRSLHLCRARWGEEVVGQGALGVIGLLGILVVVLVGIAAGIVFVPLGIALAVLGYAAVVLLLSVAGACFQAALYLFAVSGQAPPGYQSGDLMSAFGPKRSRLGSFS
jgi:hypothetical protein